ncbi:carboxymuconolactone decarboxylase family protein [Bifidobacterium aquikefiri]|uniref:carboxymuconolactone decarboxylase family protein n=1 Tax=Bifidobacterium aquikefiri TaxID=1653207 RepID=UPI0039E90248
MARIVTVEEHELSKEAADDYAALKAQGKLSNMKQALLRDHRTFKAFIGWYDSWASLADVVGNRAATVYAHAISTTNSCQLCSLFFINDLRELGLDPASFETTEAEAELQELATQIVKDPTSVSDDLFERLHQRYSDDQIVVIVGFAAQMIATNNFNSVLQIDVDRRLLPLKDEFHPATWRNNR